MFRFDNPPDCGIRRDAVDAWCETVPEHRDSRMVLEVEGQLTVLEPELATSALWQWGSDGRSKGDGGVVDQGWWPETDYFGI